MPSTLADWLPMFPWEGPPLPRFLGIYWPWQEGAEEGFLSLPTPRAMPPAARRFVGGGAVEGTEKALVPQASYTNEESWEISWSEEGLPTKIIVHREAKRS